MTHLRAILQFVWPYLRAYWRRLALGVILGVLFGLSNASFLWASKTILDRLESPKASVAAAAPVSAEATGERWLDRLDALRHRVNASVQRRVDPWLPRGGQPLDWRQVLGGLLLLPGLISLRGFLGYGASYCMNWVSERVVSDLRQSVLLKLNSLSLDFFNRSTMGDLLTRINRDVLALQSLINRGFADAVMEPVTVVSVFLGLCLVNWRLCVFVVIFLPFCLLPIVKLGRKARRAIHSSIDAIVAQANLLAEMMAGIRVIKAFGLEQQQARHFRRFCQSLIHHAMKGMQAKELVNPLIETISALGLGFLLLYVFYRQISFTDMAVFFISLTAFYAPVKRIAGLHVVFEETSVAVARLRQIFAEQPSVREPARPLPWPAFTRAIEFERVDFSYGHAVVLADVQLHIPRGRRLGIAGPSGSGKSTLVNLLFRFYDPTGGAVRVDGLDLRELSTAELRRQLALVSQEVVLFDQTVAENIADGRPGVTPAEIEAAARAAFAHDFIRALPQGYDTRIGERGVTLSGGQRQRLAIARAFVRDAPILVLDEATAALDAQAEAEVQAAIDRLAESRTVLTVAHRLATLANTDEIVVLDRGRIVERGSYHTLLRADGLFAAMARQQGIQSTSASTESREL